jgi:hypothetical protein
VAEAQFAGTQLPLGCGITTTMAKFLDAYTLHDSYWIDITLDPTCEALLIIRWDTFWTDGRVVRPSSRITQWPILLVRMPRCYMMVRSEAWTSLRWGNVYQSQDGISDAVSRVMELEEITRLFSLVPRQPTLRWIYDDTKPVQDQTVHHTTIYDHNGKPVDFFHGEEVHLLCLSQAGEVLPIPNL